MAEIEYMARFMKDINPSCECFECDPDPRGNFMPLVVMKNPECPAHRGRA